MRVAVSLLGSSLLAGGAAASDLSVNVEIPRMNVAEYHNPYIAVWIAEPSGAAVDNLAVLYDLELPDEEGETWLKDLRQWWRRSGRSLDMPIDGVSGPTRAPGEHTLYFDADAAPLADLPAGDYVLTIEASREVGGREMLSIPFAWPLAPGDALSAHGDAELGAVTVQITPAQGE